MATIVQFSDNQLFETTAAEAMGAAFDTAWASVLESARVFGSDEERDHVREILAFRIIDTAARGEFNPIKLHDDALAFLARKRPLVYGRPSPESERAQA